MCSVMYGLSAFQLVNLCSLMHGLSAFQLVNLGFYAWFVGFPTRKTWLFSMLPMVFQLVNVCSLRCELFAKRTAYGCVYVSGGML